MDLRTLFFTENECYKVGKKITPKGIMWHSTGANNPNLRRYVGPDDGAVGLNKYNNHWNNFRPDGQQKCVHAFIGKLANGAVATYQSLPWDINGWHSGGSANNSYIGFEICEDSLNDKTYFEKVYKEAVELTAYLCELYNLDPNGKNVIICHADGAKLGIASNHGDVYHWFNKFGKTMDDVRKDVAKLMVANTQGTNTEAPKELYRVRKTWADVKSQIGAFESLDNAKAEVDKNPEYKVFNSAGVCVYEPHRVQKKSITEIAQDVINGKYGNGNARRIALEKAGYNYKEVQKVVNDLLAKKTVTPKKSIDEIARAVIRGEYGNGAERRAKLEKEGYDYETVQKRVNALL